MATKTANILARVEPEVKEQAEAICNNWRKQHEDVYMYLMDSLMQ